MPTTNEENRAEKNNETTERARASRHNKLIVEQTVQTESEPTASGSSCVINPECVVNRGEPCQEDLIPIQDNRSIMKAKEQEMGLCVKLQTPEMNIKFKKPPKEMLEVTVPSVHTEAAVDVMIKEEPIDIHMETVGALRGTDACVKKETVHHEGDVNVIPDSSLQDRVTVKEEGVDEGMVERMADVCIGERSNSRTSPWTHEDSGDPKTRTESPAPSTESPHSSQTFKEETSGIINYGNEESTDSENDDDVSVPFYIPRSVLSRLETPLDEDADVPLPHPPSASDQPWGTYTFDWRTFPDPPTVSSRRETFSKIKIGPTVPNTDPCGIFLDIWDEEFMNYIAGETNRYAQQVEQQMRLQGTLDSNRISQWKDTTVSELYVFFAYLIAMGVVVNSRVKDYWCSDVFATPNFSEHLSLNRFMLLTKFIHFNDDLCATELGDFEAKIFKIKPVLQHLNGKFQMMCNLGRNIALDQSDSWLDGVQLVPNKASGIRSYEVCDAETGYLWRFEVHAHKKSVQFETVTAFVKMVMRLLQGLEQKGYTIWMDSFFNSPCLARYLKSLGFDCAGTLRTDRQFVPQELHNLNATCMKPGQISGLTSGDVDILVWRERYKVSMISTYHGNAVTQDSKSIKPSLIADYNTMMGGLDKRDSLLATYPMEKDRTKKWHKQFFRRLLNVSIFNSYIIHRSSSRSSLSHREFRMKLVGSLLANFSHVVKPPGTPFPLSHYLWEYPKVKHQCRSRFCDVCKKKVRTFCVGCKKPVCIQPCFYNMHLHLSESSETN